MSLARLQHEVEELRRRIEELKMKLTAEMKVCLPAFGFSPIYRVPYCPPPLPLQVLSLRSYRDNHERGRLVR